MSKSESNTDERSIEQKALDDLDDIASMAERAIAADVSGDATERTALLHEIHDCATSWNDPADSEVTNE